MTIFSFFKKRHERHYQSILHDLKMDIKNPDSFEEYTYDQYQCTPRQIPHWLFKQNLRAIDDFRKLKPHYRILTSMEKAAITSRFRTIHRLEIIKNIPWLFSKANTLDIRSTLSFCRKTLDINVIYKNGKYWRKEYK